VLGGGILHMRLTRSNRLRASLRQRGVAVALALAIELLVALLLWFLAPPIPGKEKGSIPSVFEIQGTRSDSDEADRKPEKASERKATSGKPRPTPPKPIEPPPPAPEPPPPPLPSTFIRMTRSEYKAADIAGKGAAPRVAPEGEAVAAAESGSQPGDSAVVGKAPNGEPLYAAEWFRRPRDAELSPYISRRALGPGWGLIACRVIADHRVEDCQELGEGPHGSGYAGSVRQAAWQFRVRAPRVGGKELVGTWVSIRITYGNADSE
jgi:type IV secretory pathway VirB10-like protein